MAAAIDVGKFLTVFAYILFFTLFFFRGILILDPDFGWHIRMGQIILESGIPAADPFSYTMRHYPIVDHEWLTNVLISIIYPRAGMTGLALIFACMATLTLFLSRRLVDSAMRRWVSVPFLLAGSTLIGFSGVRTQIITWVMIPVLFNLLFKQRYAGVRKYLIPLLFVVWVNLHGAFASGIVLMAVILVAQVIEDLVQQGSRRASGLKRFKTKGWLKQRIANISEVSGVYLIINNLFKQDKGLLFRYVFSRNKKIALVLVLSVLATFLNPYGFKIWWEVWMQISDTNLRSSIGEWSPSVNLPNFVFWAYTALSVSLVFRYRKKHSLTELAVFGFLMTAALSSKRHIPLWVIAGLPTLTKALYWLYEDAGRVLYGRIRFVKAYRAFYLLCFILFVFNILISHVHAVYFSLNSNGQGGFYPSDAAEYLRYHPPRGNLWSPYDWNGYLVWKVPGLRVFIDGMMPSWRGHIWEGESRYAFEEYNNLLLGKLPLIDLVNRYSISEIMVPSQQLNEIYFKDRVASFSAMYSQIEQMKLKKEYSDDTVVIYSLD